MGSLTQEGWSLAPWLTGLILALVIFVILIPAICSACYHWYTSKIDVSDDGGSETDSFLDDSDLYDQCSFKSYRDASVQVPAVPIAPRWPLTIRSCRVCCSSSDPRRFAPYPGGGVGPWLSTGDINCCQQHYVPPQTASIFFLPGNLGNPELPKAVFTNGLNANSCDGFRDGFRTNGGVSEKSEVVVDLCETRV